MADSVDCGLMDEAIPTATLEESGDSVSGKILSISKEQRTDFDTGELLWWPDGKPQEQYVITLDTESDGDESRRRIFARYKMLTAIQEAIRAAKHQRGVSIVGGTLTVTCVGREKLGQNKSAKLYTASFSSIPF